MSKEYIALINKRIEKLNDEDFDLEAWKSSVVSVLERIFGSSDPRLKIIDSLKIDYSSWALRDATASYNPTESCKKKGREILTTVVEELELLGVRSSGEGTSKSEMLKGTLTKESLAEINGKPKSNLRKALKNEKKESLIDAIIKLLETN